MEVPGLCILGRLWKLNPTKMMVIVSWSGRWSMTTCQFTTGKAETKTCSSGSGSGASNCRCLVMFRDPTDPQMTDVVATLQKTWKMLKFYHPYLRNESELAFANRSVSGWRLFSPFRTHFSTFSFRWDMTCWSVGPLATDGWMFCSDPLGGASSPGTTPWSWRSQA